jgi:hypothetical protein
MPNHPAGYSVSYNPTADVWAVYLGEKRITTRPTEPEAWRFIQHAEATTRLKADGSPRDTRTRARA